MIDTSNNGQTVLPTLHLLIQHRNTIFMCFCVFLLIIIIENHLIVKNKSLKYCFMKKLINIFIILFWEYSIVSTCFL